MGAAFTAFFGIPLALLGLGCAFVFSKDLKVLLLAISQSKLVTSFLE